MNNIAAPPKKTSLYLMKRLFGAYMRPYIRPMLVSMVFMALAALTTAGIAKLMEPILDTVMNGKDTSMILPIALAVLATFWVRGASTYVHTIMMNKISQSLVADIQRDLFSHFLTLDLAFFHANPSGQLISRVVNDVQVARVAIADTLTGVGKNLLTLLLLIALMFYQDWKLSLAAFVIFPFAAAFVAYVGRRLRKVSRSIQTEMAGLSDRLSQIFQGIRQVQAFGMEDHERVRAGDAIGTVRDLNIKSVRIGTLSTPVNEVLIGLVFFGIILYGGYQAAAGNMTAGQLGSFLAAFLLAYEPMKKLAKLNNSMQTGLGAAERIFDMMDLQSRLPQLSGARVLSVTKPSITFKNVDFQYDGTDEKALKNVSFTARPGKVTALVGPSGGGKSTIMNLIPRFYDPQEGQILIDDVDIRDCTVESVRRSIALVSQDITIFDDTVAANIAYGRKGAGDSDIEEAARMAAAHDFIIGFPQGYQTRVGEDGVKLSGGQRQRIAIARAILRDAPILLLDEATSALDNESERLVKEALAALEKGRTTLVIAHRLTTVHEADQIIVLDRGQIVEQGAHQDLMAGAGLYYQMYQSGLKGQ